MRYKEILERSWVSAKVQDEELDRIEFVGESVFGFMTYENMILSLMAEKGLEVCKAISEGTTFEYIEASEDNNMWYLIMMNMSFFNHKLAWGSSIRGAWWDDFKDVGNELSIKLYESRIDEPQGTKIKMCVEQWKEFIDDLIKFVG